MGAENWKIRTSADKGEGVNNRGKFADVLFGCPLGVPKTGGGGGMGRSHAVVSKVV